MLDHQIQFSKAIAEIYKPISGRMSDPDSLIPEGNPEGIQACDEYETIVNDLKTTLTPELEMIETRIIQPADELMEVIKVIRKTATKRHHKQLDYDRHRGSLTKLQNKNEKNLKEEKALYKAEADVELATQEFEYYNDLLKNELPKLFALEREFIAPLFNSFYYMQLNIFYTLHERMQNINIGYFDLTTDIEAAFEKKRGSVQELAEKLSITRFRTQAPKMKLNQKKFGKAEETKQRPASLDLAAGKGSDTPPPPYSATTLSTASPALGKTSLGTGVGRSNSTGGMYAAAAAKKTVPPPPKPKPKTLGVTVENATALYDFEAQANGDLTFEAGDFIEIVSRTENENEWWTGKLRNEQGQFPGNYVRLN